MGYSSRRRFLQHAAGAAASLALLPKFARADVNSSIRMAVIGFNGRGNNHIKAFSNELVALCDCDRNVLGKAAQQFERQHGRKLDQVVDYRELLDRDDIDAVSIATPNHTHALIAIAAAEAGKHVYCEKPVSQCLWEGRQLVNAARRFDRIIQCGTQARSSDAIQQAVEYVRSGRLGKIKRVVGNCYKPRPSIGKLDKPLAISKEIDFDLWCGPAAKVDLYRPKFHYDWHWDFNTGCGDIGNQGAHQVDVARWFLGESTLAPRVISIGGRLGYDDAGDTPNTQVVWYDYASAPLVFEVRGLPESKAAQKRWDQGVMDHYKDSQIGVIVECDDGYVFNSSSDYGLAQAFSLDGEEIERWTGEGDHFKNFLDTLKSGRPEHLNAEVEEGHVSAALCHTGNISHRLGEKRTAAEISSVIASNPQLEQFVGGMLEHLRANDVNVDEPIVTLGPWLEVDVASERFTNSEAANHLVRREDRAPFVVPQIA